MIKAFGFGLRAAVVASTLALAACSSGGMDMSPGALVSGGRDIAAEQETMERFAAVQVCPQVQVREGTQVLRRFDRGRQDDPSGLAYQATIRQFARECRVAADGGSVIKVGVTGRVITGPAGPGGGSYTLPLRVVLVKNGSEVLYSQVHPVAATISPGQGSTAWTQVVDGLSVPFQQGDGRFEIYVGFDETAGSS